MIDFNYAESIIDTAIIPRIAPLFKIVFEFSYACSIPLAILLMFFTVVNFAIQRKRKGIK